MTKLNVALIGLGKMGSLHLQALARLKQEGMINKIVCVDVVPRREAEVFCTEFYRTSFKDYNPVNIDIAFIATPTVTHKEAIFKMLEYNIHVFVEKPAVTDIDSLYNIIRTAKSRGLRIFAGHIERVNSVVKFLKNILSELHENVTGFITVRFNRTPPYPKNYVNVLWDLLIHDLDIMVYLFNVKSSDNINIVSRIIHQGPDNVPYKCYVSYTIGDIVGFSSAGWVKEDYALRRLLIICEDYAIEADLYTRKVMQLLRNREVVVSQIPPEDPIYVEDKTVLEGLLNEQDTIFDLENLIPTYELVYRIEKGL